jgi:hypothetical protein
LAFAQSGEIGGMHKNQILFPPHPLIAVTKTIPASQIPLLLDHPKKVTMVKVAMVKLLALRTTQL